jgi:PAS domain S-box-containing protein
MELSLENKLKIGFIGNMLIVALCGGAFVFRTYFHPEESASKTLDLIVLSLIGVSMILPVVVYFIIRAQLDAKKRSQQALLDNRLLLQSILDNTNSPMSIKKLNGEYMLLNRECEKLFHVSVGDVIGKTDHDLFPKEVADELRNADLEVLKVAKELKMEEKFTLDDGQHTFLSAKFPLYDAKGRIYAIGTISTDITDRKDSENSILEADKFFQMSLDILVVASDQKFLKFNPALSRILGYSDEELSGSTFFSFILPEDVEITKNQIGKLLEGQKLVNFQNRWKCKDRSVKWLNWRAQADLTTGKLYALAHDVTEKVKNDETLRIAEQFFNMSFDMLVVAKGEYFIKVNNAFTRILGYAMKDMADKPFLSFAHPDDLTASTEAIKSLVRGTSVVNHRARARCKDGSYKWLEWTSTLDPESGLIYAVARDITEQVKLEAGRQLAINELMANEEKLELILENINEGVIVTDEKKEVMLANYVANEMFGIRNNDKITGNLTDRFELYFPDEKTIFPSQLLPLEKALGGEPTNDVDIVLWDPKQQEKRRVLMSGRPLVDTQDRVVAAVVTVKDISRYKQLEEELQVTEQKYRRLIGFKKDQSEDVPEAKLVGRINGKLPH